MEGVVMYIIVNSDLSMAKGKTASQCCHSVCGVTRILERSNRDGKIYKEWIRSGETKIVLRATLQEMKKILDEYEVDKQVKRESEGVWCMCVHDAGRTQIPDQSLTTIAFRPMSRSEAPDFLRKLKLL